MTGRFNLSLRHELHGPNLIIRVGRISRPAIDGSTGGGVAVIHVEILVWPANVSKSIVQKNKDC